MRLGHWLIVPLVAFSWWSAEEGRLDWHRLSGYALLTLVLFRLAWGVTGSQTAQFVNFLRGPKTISAYLRGKSGAVIGHNPIGGWSIALLLLLMVAQAMLGLFAVDIDGIESGPLAVFVSFDVGRAAAAAHHLVFNALLGLIALHVAAIGFYALARRDNLIGPMITGAKAIDPAPPSPPKMAPLWLALILVCLSGLVVFAISKAFWLF